MPPSPLPDESSIQAVATGEIYDVAVVGAGVVGCAMARRFTLEGARVIVIDKAADILEGASKGNSAILHTGFDAPEGSLELDCIKRGCQEFADIRDSLGLPVLETGALVVAWNGEQEAALDRLAGIFATDITTASRTCLMNLETGRWDADLCHLFGVPMEALPEIRPTMGEFGAITVAGRQVPVTASVVDQQASLYGHGCRRAGDAKITFGTGAFALALTGQTICRVPERGLLPTVAWQRAGEAPVHALDGGVCCASSAVNWARSLGLFRQFSEIDSFDAPPAIARGLAFVPALTGLACPHWDRSAAGLWIGLSLDTTSRDLVQAVLEGVALRAGEVIAEMSRQVPIGDEISIDGGMVANPYFCQFLADVLARRVKVQVMSELTAKGTALMAAGSADGGDEETVDLQVYEPLNPSGQWVDLLARAVERSRGWR